MRVQYDWDYEAWTLRFGEVYLNLDGLGFFFKNRARMVELLERDGYVVDHFGYVN